MSASLASLQRALTGQSHRAVLFDYHGTLVHRTVPPRHVERVACRHLAEALGIGASGADLYALRRRVAKSLADRSQEAGLDRDYCLSALAAEIEPLLRERATLHTAGAALVDLVLAVEVETEASLQVLQTELVDLLREAAAGGHDFHLVSDYHLPSSHLCRILDRHGIQDLFGARLRVLRSRPDQALGPPLPPSSRGAGITGRRCPDGRGSPRGRPGGSSRDRALGDRGRHRHRGTRSAEKTPKPSRRRSSCSSMPACGRVGPRTSSVRWR